MEKEKANVEQTEEKRKSLISFNKMEFQKLVVGDLLSTSQGRTVLKNYKQSEVREYVEGYKNVKNQERLVEISEVLYARSPQYKRLIKYFAGMALFPCVISPIKDISTANRNRVMKQYTQIGELVKMMNIRHEMIKALTVAFQKDVFFGYIYRTKRDFYIPSIDASLCKISSIEDGVYNYSFNMAYFDRNPELLGLWAQEFQTKYNQWKIAKKKDSKISDYVELDAKNTICIKVNQEMTEIFPPFAGSFDAIFDIEGFKRLRKDKEELSNYMLLVQSLPIREDSDDNNDFMIDEDMFAYFHNMVSNSVPDNVGVATTPMKIDAVRFDKDKADSDGVAKATRDFWEGNGTSQLLFNSDKSTSEGVKMGIKTDEEIVFGVVSQIERWLNRYLKFEYKDIMFSVSILHVTYFNRKEVYEMYIDAGQYGLPIKSHISAIIGLSPIEVSGMAYLENDLLELHEKFIPLASSHTQSGSDDKGGRPKTDEPSDETARGIDKPN